MKIIKPSVEFYGAVPTEYNAALKFIEMAGRTCYKSEDKITEDSAEGFVKKLIKAGHLAMVEHSNMVVRAEKPPVFYDDNLGVVGKYIQLFTDIEYVYAGGSLTAWFQMYNELPEIFWPFLGVYGRMFDLPARTRTGRGTGEWEVCPYDEIPKELHRYSAKFICDRGVSHELVRHRPCSFAQESTRYVNYGGKDMEFIEPDGFEDWSQTQIGSFWHVCKTAEEHYNFQVSTGLKPQQARAVLPNALKTEIVVTADAAEWKHLFKLRCAPAAHPDFRRLAVPLRDKFIEEGIL